MSKTNGRAAPAEKLEDFTFPDTGRTVQIRKVSTLIRAEIRRQVAAEPAFIEPTPPMVEVDYGDGKIRTPNPAHSTYQQLMREWEGRINREVGERLKAIVIRRGVVVDQIDTAAVDQARADLAAIGINTSAYDDRYAYIAFVCIGSESDLKDLLKATFERSAPSEAAIQAHIATFQSDVREQESVE
jgi:hypothetical protein